MKTYKIIIKPLTGFGTSIKGDTLFGHICWQIFYDSQLFGKSLMELLKDYDTEPFLIVSSAFPVVEGKIYLKKPSMPLNKLFNLSEEEIIQKRKELKAKSHFVFEQPLKPLNQIEYEKIEFLKEDSQTRCTINRLTGTTAEPPFTPYTIDKTYYRCDLAVFVGLRDDLEIESCKEALKRIGKHGYGKDTTVGYGKFELLELETIKFIDSSKNPNALYTLSPSVPEMNKLKDIYFTPFIRYGRHGDIYARAKNQFKNPVIFADEASVVISEQMPEKQYIGKAVKNLSKTIPEAVTQGYSLVIPVEVTA